MRSLCLAWMLVACVTLPVSAQGRRIAWEQPAPVGALTFNSTEAAAYVYRYYVQGSTVGMVITGVTCTTTNSPLIKTCSAPLPADLDLGTAFDATASVQGNESGHSNSVTVTAPIVPAVPARLRLLGKLVSPVWALGSKVSRLM